MKITYCNSDDDLSFLENKKVILHCSIDSAEYAGIITKETKTVLGERQTYLVFLSNCPQNCEFGSASTFECETYSGYKTAMYVGKGCKDFRFAIRYSENELFKDEWASVSLKNQEEYSRRVANRKAGISKF